MIYLPNDFLFLKRSNPSGYCRKPFVHGTRHRRPNGNTFVKFFDESYGYRRVENTVIDLPCRDFESIFTRFTLLTNIRTRRNVFPEHLSSRKRVCHNVYVCATNNS